MEVDRIFICTEMDILGLDTFWLLARISHQAAESTDKVLLVAAKLE
jgi:hypothetical protein